MPTTELIATTTAMLCLLAGFAVLVRFFRGWLLHRTLRKAIDRDSAAAPALIDRIEAMESGRSALGNDDRNGMVLIALGLAIAGAGLIGFGGEFEMRLFLGAALFPLLVGAALLLRRKLLKRELAEEAALAADRGA